MAVQMYRERHFVEIEESDIIIWDESTREGLKYEDPADGKNIYKFEFLDSLNFEVPKITKPNLEEISQLGISSEDFLIKLEDWKKRTFESASENEKLHKEIRSLK
jgi:hypothetical protein